MHLREEFLAFVDGYSPGQSTSARLKRQRAATIVRPEGDGREMGHLRPPTRKRCPQNVGPEVSLTLGKAVVTSEMLKALTGCEWEASWRRKRGQVVGMSSMRGGRSKGHGTVVLRSPGSRESTRLSSGTWARSLHFQEFYELVLIIAMTKT